MSAQNEFDKKYVTSSEICSTLQICRTTLLQARRAGRLPDAVVVGDGQICLWEREVVTPYLNAWKVILDVRRGGVAA
jgi:hypothetical protein